VIVAVWLGMHVRCAFSFVSRSLPLLVLERSASRKPPVLTDTSDADPWSPPFNSRQSRKRRRGASSAVAGAIRSIEEQLRFDAGNQPPGDSLAAPQPLKQGSVLRELRAGKAAGTGLSQA